MRGELRASATERGGVDEPESVIVCAEGIPEATTLSVFAPVRSLPPSGGDEVLPLGSVKNRTIQKQTGSGTQFTLAAHVLATRPKASFLQVKLQAKKASREVRDIIRPR